MSKPWLDLRQNLLDKKEIIEEELRTIDSVLIALAIIEEYRTEQVVLKQERVNEEIKSNQSVSPWENFCDAVKICVSI